MGAHIADAIPAPSPNCEPRRGRDAPDLVILHFTAMASAEAALERLRDPSAKVSAHYLIDLDGRLWALAPERLRAWHAGVAFWGGDSDVNSRSIGIELANPAGAAGPAHPFPEPQMARLEALLDGVAERWRLPAEAVLAHSDVAPGRKDDPGPRFDWARLARAGRAVGPPSARADDALGAPAIDAAGAARFYDALTRIGYGDWPADALREAFRLRFRPQLARLSPGAPLDVEDLRRAVCVAERWSSEGRSHVVA